MKNLLFLASIFSFLIACGNDSQEKKAAIQPPKETIKVYALDGGELILNLGFFSTDSSYAMGNMRKSANTILLIEHPKGRLIWDTGMPDAMADLPLEERSQDLGSFEIKTKLIDQLAEMGLTPDSIDYLALSHTHFDHAGNAAYFANANWIVSQAELDFIFSDHPMAEAAQPLVVPIKEAKKTFTDGVHDVFGDGKVMIHPFPGHTPGHGVLYIDFDSRQDALFTGDLYHLKENRQYLRMPIFNVNFEQTKKSMEAFEQLVKEKDAEVFIQHEAAHFEKLPRYPNYWN